MSVRKVYGTLTTTATLRVIASLYEHDLDFEFVPVNLDAGEHKQDPFLLLNPFGEVPAFKDGDLTLFESRTIMRYIAFGYPKEGKEHIFKDPLIQGIVAAWIDVEDHQFNPPASKIIEELVFKPNRGDSMSPNSKENVNVVAEEEAKLAKVLDVYEERLAQSKFLGGEKFTSADLTHLPSLHYLMAITSTRRLFESRPHVANWCRNIMSRPAWLQVVDVIQKNCNQI